MIELRRKEETHRIRTEKNRKSINGASAKVKMTWETGIDLDVHAFAFTAGGAFVHIFSATKNQRIQTSAWTLMQA